MRSYLELIRPNIGLLSVFGLIAGLLIVKVPLSLWILPTISIFFITSSGNIINDYFDLPIDKINKPKRPLPEGRVTIKETLVLFMVSTLLSLLSGFFVSFNFFLLAILNTILIFLYSWKFKKAIIGNSIDSWLACSVFIAPVLVLNGLEMLLSSPVIILAIIAFFGNYGREILKDVEDIKGDKMNGAETLPIVFGHIKAIILGKFLIFITSLLLFLPYIVGYFSELYLVLAFFCFLFGVYILSIEKIKKVQKMIKVLMFLVILSFLIAVFSS